MAEGYLDFVAGIGLPASSLEDYCELQSIMRFASAAARDAALATVKTEGMCAYLKDVNTLTVYTGTATTWSTVGPILGSLSAFPSAPTLTQSATVTKTVAYAFYCRIGRMIIGNVTLTATGAGVGANAVVVGLPVPATTNLSAIGSGYIIDASTGILYGATLNLTSASTANFIGDSATAALGVAKFTAALAAGDTVGYSFMYEAAGDA